MSGCLVIRRLFGIEPKNRVRLNTYIEKELIDMVRERKMDIANTMNLALEQYLIRQGIIKTSPNTPDILEQSFINLIKTF